MRTFIFGILTGLTWYLAAMYRVESLMILAVIEVWVLLGMPVCVWYIRRNLEITFSQRFMAVNRSEYIECPFWLHNRGILPVSRIRIHFSYVYEGESARRHAVFLGNIDQKGNDREKLRLPVPWNGKLLVYMEKIEIYDYFSLFKAKIRCKEEMTITILPSEGDMCTEAELPNGTERFMQNEMLLRGNESKEFLQIREYVQGEPYRQIHWKLSVRTGTLQVKEYLEERQKSVFVCLDFCGYDKKSQREISEFYDILWALVLRLFEERYVVWLEWKNRMDMVIGRTVADEETLAEVFGLLYERDWSKERYGMDMHDKEKERFFLLKMELT